MLNWNYKTHTAFECSGIPIGSNRLWLGRLLYQCTWVKGPACCVHKGGDAGFISAAACTGDFLRRCTRCGLAKGICCLKPAGCSGCLQHRVQTHKVKQDLCRQERVHKLSGPYPSLGQNQGEFQPQTRVNLDGYVDGTRTGQCVGSGYGLHLWCSMKQACQPGRPMALPCAMEWLVVS